MIVILGYFLNNLSRERDERRPVEVCGSDALHRDGADCPRGTGHFCSGHEATGGAIPPTDSYLGDKYGPDWINGPVGNPSLEGFLPGLEQGRPCDHPAGDPD